MGNALRNGLVERDLSNLVYVDILGRGESEISFMLEKKDGACRYHMRYTRGWERRGDRRTPLAALFVDKASIRQDILDGQLKKSEITEQERQETQQELSLINRRWESERSQNVLKR